MSKHCVPNCREMIRVQCWTGHWVITCVYRVSEVEKSSQMNHKTLYFSNVSLSKASISSIHIILFTVETHKDKRGVTAVFQNKEINCLAADKKKLSRLHFCDAIEPMSIDRSAISGVSIKDSS